MGKAEPNTLQKGSLFYKRSPFQGETLDGFCFGGLWKPAEAGRKLSCKARDCRIMSLHDFQQLGRI